MKLLVKIGILVFALVVELILSNMLNFNTVKPDLVLIVVICLSFISTSEEGIIAGFLGGLLKDIFSVHLLGMNALVKTVICYLSGIIREKVFSQHLLWIVIISVFFFTIVNNGIIFLLLNALHTDYDFVGVLKKTTLIQAVINAILAPLILVGIQKLFSYLKQQG
ncbi:MAG: rod shape-determining protein MreD [Candidatus Atribacteria bacterium]|nr:rod shape-determining protein MreD [Candidatus Atribacteria bacterium]